MRAVYRSQILWHHPWRVRMKVELDWTNLCIYVSSHWRASQLADKTRDMKGSGRISNRHDDRLWWPVEWISFHCLHPVTTVLLILLMTSLITHHPSVKGVTKSYTWLHLFFATPLHKASLRMHCYTVYPLYCPTSLYTLCEGRGLQLFAWD